MSWLADSARAVAATGEPVSWHTPLGLPIVQPYRRKAGPQLATVFQPAPVHGQAKLPQFGAPWLGVFLHVPAMWNHDAWRSLTYGGWLCISPQARLSSPVGMNLHLNLRPSRRATWGLCHPSGGWLCAVFVPHPRQPLCGSSGCIGTKAGLRCECAGTSRTRSM